MKSTLIAATALATALAGTAMAQDNPTVGGAPMMADMTIVENASAAPNLTTLVAAVAQAGLVDTLAGPGPFTVFAPTDDAFTKLPSGTVENLLKPENIEQLQAILKFHVVPGRVYSDQAVAAGSAATLQGDKLNIAVKDGVATVNGAEIVTVDIDATNGVIHVIDAVLLPN